MKVLANSNAPSKRQLTVSLGVLLTLAGVIGIGFQTILPAEMADFLFPILATVTIFTLFSMALRWQVGDSLFGELGFLYLGLAVAYTVLPALAFMLGSFNPGDPLAVLFSASSELSVHLWRHVLFIFGVATGYLLVRGHQTTQLITIKDPKRKDGRTITFLIGLIMICILFIILLSAPVNSYYDHYTRYDHLPWLIRKFVSLCVRLNLGFYSILLTFLFLNHKKYKLLTAIIVIIICTHETTYSFGSRIQTLIILLQVICLYNYTIQTITVKRGLFVCAVLAALFSIMELFRSLEFDLNSAKDMVSQEGFKSASEFGSVFFTGFHLYAERAQGVLPPTEWPMFFNEFISLFTFGDFLQWNPMDWYWKNYYPDSVVAPFTLGPIADSAIWGGEVDLLLRGLINGAFFAYLVRWFLRHKHRWWAVAIYVYCYATCILTLKYGIFYLLNPLSKNMLPTLLMIALIRSFISSKQNSTLADKIGA